MPSKLIISLDFELFWGVSESQSLNSYGQNILGEWEAIPKILKLFERYCVKATWATVGMLMCKDFKEWSNFRPKLMPDYRSKKGSNYDLAHLVKDHPRMFFGRELVEQILATSGQEIGGHSYSHIYCNDPEISMHHFEADLECAGAIAKNLGLHYRSFVFPRNQIRHDYLASLARAGYCVYRGNSAHWAYRENIELNKCLKKIQRAARLLDSHISLSGPNLCIPKITNYSKMINCPASFFLRPCREHSSVFESMRLWRLKSAMLHAAKSQQDMHLWWHPHNFGVNIEQNLNFLESILRYFKMLEHEYGMESINMGNLAGLIK